MSPAAVPESSGERSAFPESLLRYEIRDGLAWVTIDDGKANAFTLQVIRDLHDVLDRSEKAGPDNIRALVIEGRPGYLSGGFDLGVMRSGPLQALELATAGGELFVRIFGSPVPVVVACTGHAVGAGTLLMLGADARIGVMGNFRIGLIETQIGLALPHWAMHLARERVNRAHLQAATVGARIYDPAAACEVGFLDTVVPADELADAVRAEADCWGSLPREAYAAQVRVNRGAVLDRITSDFVRDRERGEISETG